jgi:transposase
MSANANQLPASDHVPDSTLDETSSLDWEYINDFLHLSGWKTIAISKTEHAYHVAAELLTLPTCVCGNPQEKLIPAGTLIQGMWDEPRDSRRVRIHFKRKRFKCACGKHLLQPLEGVAKNRSVTKRCAKYTALEALCRPFDAVAENVGVSSKTVKEIFADFVCELESAREIRAPQILGIDGVCVGRRKYKRSYCLLTDISELRVLELLSKSTELELARFLKQLPHQDDVKVVVIDMSVGFRVVVERCLPHAKIVIDPFHVLRMLNDAVNAVVRAKQEGLTGTQRRALMKGGNRFLLLKRRFELTKGEQDKLEKWFESAPEFRLAFNAKEAGYDIWKYATSRQDAERRFEKWRNGIPKEVAPAFRKFLKTVERWGKYIFNFFDHRVTNAFTESKNRDVKSLQRQGRRTSFIVLRARLIYMTATRKPQAPKGEVDTRQIREVLRRAKENQS